MFWNKYKRRGMSVLKWCKGSREVVTNVGPCHMGGMWRGRCPKCYKTVAVNKSTHKSMWHVPYKVM